VKELVGKERERIRGGGDMGEKWEEEKDERRV
jgi:hypothetical protein